MSDAFSASMASLPVSEAFTLASSSATRAASFASLAFASIATAGCLATAALRSRSPPSVARAAESSVVSRLTAHRPAAACAAMKRPHSVLLPSLFPLLLGACGDKTAATGAADATPAAATATPPDPACLAKADAADGAVDKVVHKCPSCGLAMDGKAEHASRIAGYELHSCSAGCKSGLEADPGGVLAAACKR
jgi:hypothetical protein